MTPIVHCEVEGKPYQLDLPEAPFEGAVRQLGRYCYVFAADAEGQLYYHSINSGPDSNAFSEMSFAPPSPGDMLRGVRNIVEDVLGL